MPPKKNWGAIRRINQHKAKSRANKGRPGPNKHAQKKETIRQHRNWKDNQNNRDTRDNTRRANQGTVVSGGQTFDRANTLANLEGQASTSSGIISGLGHIVQRGQDIYKQAHRGATQLLGASNVRRLEQQAISARDRFVQHALNRALGSDSDQQTDDDSLNSSDFEEVNEPTEREGTQESQQAAIEESHQDMSNEQPSTIDAMDTSEAAVGGANNAGGGVAKLSSSAGAASSGMGVRGTVERPVGRIQRPLQFTQTFYKQYSIRINTTPIDYVYTPEVNVVPTNFYYRLPFHDIPVEYIGFYLSQQEMSQLAIFGRSEVEHVSCSAYMNTAIIPFETQSSAAAIGNNNVGVSAVSFNNLRNKRWGEIPNGENYVKNIFWGKHSTNLTQTASVSTSIGPNPPAWLTTRTFDRRFQYFIQPKLSIPNCDDSARFTDAIYYPTYFPWRNFIKKRWNCSISEGWFDKYEWQPENKYLFGQNLLNAVTLSPEQNNEAIGRFLASNQKNVFTLNKTQTNTDDTGGCSTTVNTNTIDILNKHQAQYNGNVLAGVGVGAEVITGPQTIPAINTTTIDYAKMKLDVNHNWSELGQGQYSTKMPTMTFGLEPLINNTETNTNIDAYVEIILQTSITVAVKSNPDYLYLGGGNVIDEPFNAPFFKTPQVMPVSQIRLQNGTNNVVDATYTTYEDTSGFDLSLSTNDKRVLTETSNTLNGINFDNTLAGEAPIRRSKRIEEKNKENEKADGKTQTEKINNIRKQLFK